MRRKDERRKEVLILSLSYFCPTSSSHACCAFDFTLLSSDIPAALCGPALHLRCVAGRC